MNNHVCPNCGRYVDQNTIHYCYYTYPNQVGFNYECPDCRGKFNNAILKSELVNADANYNGGYYRYYYICPFCGKEMVGLSNQ